jgi:hypothetical protein
MRNTPPTTRLRGRMRPAALSVSALAVTALMSTALPAGAAITASGETAEGVPAMFHDSEGIAVQLCGDPCAEPVEPGNPGGGEPTFPAANSEAPYFSAEATAGPLSAIYAIEALSDETGAVSVVNVARFRARGLTANATYTIQDPWGTTRCGTSAAGRLQDCFTEVEVGEGVGAGPVQSFLRRTNAPAGTLGDIESPGAVTGSPTGFNRVSIQGPGVNESTTSFTVVGELAEDTAMSQISTRSLAMGNRNNAAPVVANISYSSFGTANAVPLVSKSGSGASAFTIDPSACTSVAPGSSCNISVTYTPQANRTSSAMLVIDDNGLAAPRQVTLTGVGPDTRAPALISRTPDRGTTGVRPGRNVSVQFSEAVVGVNRNSFALVNNETGKKVRAVVSRKAGNRFVLNPARSLARGTTYSVQLDGGATAIRDLSGNAARDAAWRFRTR